MQMCFLSAIRAYTLHHLLRISPSKMFRDKYSNYIANQKSGMSKCCKSSMAWVYEDRMCVYVCLRCLCIRLHSTNEIVKRQKRWQRLSEKFRWNRLQMSSPAKRMRGKYNRNTNQPTDTHARFLFLAHAPAPHKRATHSISFNRF